MTMQQPPGWTIEFYTDARGKNAVVEFISGLPERERAKARNYLRLLREFGILCGKSPPPSSGWQNFWKGERNEHEYSI